MVLHAINVTGCLLAGFVLVRLQTMGERLCVLVITGFWVGRHHERFRHWGHWWATTVR